MKGLQHIINMLMVLLFVNCSKEEAVPVVADFNVEIVSEDYSVPVEAVIVNNTTGADEYEWIFEGATPESSLRRNPGAITYSASGSYIIILRAFNRDGIEDEKQITLDLDAPVIIDFEAVVQDNNFSPVVVNINNKTEGANSYLWTFQGGNPASSSIENPGDITFETPGDHKITLEVGNGRETHTKDTIITVAPDLVTDFEWEVAFQDKDLQVPVTLTMKNQSISATTYQWSFEGGMPATSSDENPQVTFSTEGTHEITLTASNGKKTRSITKTITLVADTNIKVFEDIRFGINTVHNSDVIGSFFSGFTEKTYTNSEINSENGAQIDLVFFGLNADFSFNRFYAPDELEDTTFDPIPNATHTKFINSQELCGCSASLTSAQFDAMIDDSILSGLVITETTGGLQSFNTTTPRVVLFETSDGRKGAVKIKRFVSDGLNSYIETDIKIQKIANN